VRGGTPTPLIDATCSGATSQPGRLSGFHAPIKKLNPINYKIKF